MGDLAKFANANNAFLKWDENNSISGIYKGYSFVDDPFKKGESAVKYTMLGDDGKERSFNSGSARLARAMDKVVVGDHIRIIRTGTGFQTDFVVTKLGVSPAPQTPPAPVEPPHEETVQDTVMTDIAEEHIADTVNPEDVPF